jgi:hypothetical protein
MNKKHPIVVLTCFYFSDGHPPLRELDNKAIVVGLVAKVFTLSKKESI